MRIRRTEEIKTKIRRSNDKNLLTIINVYAPTTDIAEKDPNILNEMYEQLGKVIHEIKDTSLTIVAGDMNSKIGKAKEDEECCGKYSRGERNKSGQKLIEFCNAEKLFIANSAFKHPARHITTWENQRILETDGKKRVLTITKEIIC